MTKFRKKPVVVEAEQWFPGKPVKGVCGDDPTRLCGCTVFYGTASNQPHVHHAHIGHPVLLEPDDWIVPRPDGKHWFAVKSDIFEATYEPVEER